ncbi:Survival of motor neuron-related-splicing factor 30 [Toxocara canis]|uniref:Survival of motor neuron-related-splicing factor 30 n=1 Tax=Toxocara canis TaxID=6265 RepID=A0A0B2VAN3_TOXCA|nr:Survival of motor neuron-related-splicing factor 30 [Toxocara canis]
MSVTNELASYKLQLEQVEAALESEPDNEELAKLKIDLLEVIQLQEELTKDAVGVAAQQQPPTEVGDRCKAHSTNGQKYLAVIDGFTQECAAITFVGKGTKHMVKTGDLSPVTDEDNKTYVWEKSVKNTHHRKSEWQMERERRRLRALKKEHRRKELEEAKEDEKNKWLSFNARAASRSMKGFKRPTASGSAPDGPAWGITTHTSISSRRDFGAFKSTQRGNMDSLF